MYTVSKLPNCKNYFLEIDRRPIWLSYPKSVPTGFQYDCRSMGKPDHDKLYSYSGDVNIKQMLTQIINKDVDTLTDRHAFSYNMLTAFNSIICGFMLLLLSGTRLGVYRIAGLLCSVWSL
uniref:Uncharacterized protein n=1 Tax=Glossina austeni TaxID=7395 RepID=A0A1A9VWB2_GLOAU